MPLFQCACALLASLALPAVGQQIPAPPPEPSPAAVQTDPDPAPGKPMHIGGSVKPPVAISTVPPKFTDEARRTQFSGNVLVYLYVDKNGNPTYIRVVKGLGMGLDEKAVEAVRQYRFKPATLNGGPVTVDLYVDVNFQVH